MLEISAHTGPLPVVPPEAVVQADDFFTVAEDVSYALVPRLGMEGAWTVFDDGSYVLGWTP